MSPACVALSSLSQCVQTLPAVKGLTPDPFGSLPSGDLRHHCRDAVAVGRLEFLQAFAEALAPHLRVADLRAERSTRMRRRAELRTCEVVPAGVQIHIVPAVRQRCVEIFLDHADALVSLHRAALRLLCFIEIVALQVERFAGLPDLLCLCPELRTVFRCEVPGLFLLLLMQLDDPEPAVACDVTEVASLTVRGSDS